MVFLNPAFLWAATAVIVPILVHLFNFRKPRRMNFSNVAFVREVNRSVVRRMRLRDLLLLLFRILAILALVFMFAGPVWVSDSEGKNIADARSVLILLDDSPSMRAADAEGTYLYQATQMAKTIVENGNSQDEFLVMPFSELRPGQPYQKSQEVQARLDQIQEGNNSPSLDQLLQLLPGLTEKSHMPEKMVYILSDFQESSMRADTELKDQNSDLKIICIPVGKNQTHNRFLSDLQLNYPILEKGQNNGIRAIFNNQSTEKAEAVEVSLKINGRPAGSTRVSAEPGDTASVLLNFTPEKGGWLEGSVQVQDPVTGFDNQRFFSVNIPDSNRVLVVYGEGLEDKYLRTVLNKVLSQFQFVWVSEKRFGDENPAEYSAVVLAGLQQISPGTSRQLINWVQEGGSLMIFPHPAQDLNGLNSIMQSAGAGQYLSRRDSKEGVKVKSPDAANPLFEGVFRKGKNAQAEGPQVYSWFPFQKSQASLARDIMLFPDGSPFMLEVKSGQGTLMAFSVYPDGRMSDFPMKSIFLPVLYRSLLVMTHTSRSGLFIPLGSQDPVILKSSGQEVVKLKGQGREDFVPEQFSRPGQLVLNFQRQFPAPGTYEIQAKNMGGEKIAFNFPDAESEMAVLRGDALNRKLSEYSSVFGEIKVMESHKDSLASDLTLNETGIALWKLFLLLALLCIAAEVVLLFIYARKTGDETLIAS